MQPRCCGRGGSGCANGASRKDRLHVTTAPGSVVTVTEVISAPVGALDSSGFSSGQTFFQATKTAGATGVATFTLPISASLFTPGKGGTVKVTVESNTGGKFTFYRTIVAVREINLRLLIQPQETTRGNKRSVFQLGHLKGGTSTYTALVLCDKNAALTANLTLGNYVSGPKIATCGAGGRAKFKFSVPNNVAPAKGKGTISVTSAYRSATITRSATFTYSSKR